MASLHPLHEILELSRQQKSLLEREAWEEAAELQERRQRLIEAHLPLDDGLLADRSIAETLQQIIALDQQMFALAGSARSEIGRLLGKISQGKQAVRAYRATSTR